VLIIDLYLRVIAMKDMVPVSGRCGYSQTYARENPHKKGICHPGTSFLDLLESAPG